MTSIPPTPPGLKASAPFVQRAQELSEREPAVAYWCYLYAAKLALQGSATSSRECKTWLLSVMDYLEKEKARLSGNEAVTSETVAASYVENFALKIFLNADNEDRAGKASRKTAKTFLAASIFLDLLHVFGEINPEIEEKIKYSKWKAADIVKALKEGRVPMAGPPASQDEEQELNALMSDANNHDQQQQQQQQQHFDVPQEHLPPPGNPFQAGHFTSAVEPSRYNAPPPVAPPMSSSSPALPPRTPVAASAPTPAGSYQLQYHPQTLSQAQKYSRFAISALEYEDVPTAVSNLQKALALLQVAATEPAARRSRRVDDVCSKFKHHFRPTEQSRAFYTARGGIVFQELAAAVWDCSLRFHRECFRARIVNNTVYMVEPLTKGWDSRGLATLLQLQEAVDAIRIASQDAAEENGDADVEHFPNIEFMVHIGDHHHTEYPYWSFSRTPDQRGGWVMPEYSLYGWPEAGFQSWRVMRKALLRVGETTSWTEKRDELLWRGGNLVTVRKSLLRTIASHPDMFPAPEFDIHPTLTADDNKRLYVPMLDQCQRRYLLYTEGWAHSGRLKYQLHCGSVIVSHRLQFLEHFAHLLENGTHWVMLPDNDWTRLGPTMQGLRADPEQAAAMAKRGLQLAQEVFSPEAVNCFIRDMVWAYSDVMRWQVAPQPSRDSVSARDLVGRVVSSPTVLNQIKTLLTRPRLTSQQPPGK
ncbi:hypothetical protein RI367_003053 [Sorochytrium milnesiophthora]